MGKLGDKKFPPSQSWNLWFLWLRAAKWNRCLYSSVKLRFSLGALMTALCPLATKTPRYPLVHISLPWSSQTQCLGLRHFVKRLQSRQVEPPRRCAMNVYANGACGGFLDLVLASSTMCAHVCHGTRATGQTLGITELFLLQR